MSEYELFSQYLKTRAHNNGESRIKMAFILKFLVLIQLSLDSLNLNRASHSRKLSRS